MRMSCNGCRILRKGCSDDCTIKPCLDWIKSPDSQANATLFLAKFYGRAGLINLIEAGPPHLRPAIFKSLLYEACGRIVDPVSGSVGLLWSGNWAHCQAAVDAVLRGSPITGNPSSSSSSITSVAPALHSRIPPLKTYDIRHVSRNTSAADKTINKTRFKRSATVHRPRVLSGMAFGGPIQEPWMTHRAVALAVESNNNNIFFDDESIFSVETVEGSPISIMKTTTPNLLGRAWTFNCQNDGNEEVGLELTLGLSTPANK